MQSVYSKAPTAVFWSERIILINISLLISLYWEFSWLLVGIYGISTFVGYLTPNPFYVNSKFYFKQSSLAWVHSLIVKNISISS